MSADKNVTDKVDDEVSALSKKDIEELYEAHQNLNPRNTKKETRKDWI